MRDVLGADCLLAEAALEGKSAREADPANGFDVVLRLALGHPAPGDPLAVDLDVIATQLRDPDVAIAEAARQTIRRDLHMEPDDFARLLTVKTKADPRPEEWVEVYSILTTAQESKREFPLWLAEEEAVQTGVVYWQALKSRLPRWRANGEARAEWRQALNTRAQRPLIDPDLIGQEDLTTFSSGPAFDLWFARRQDIDAQMSALENGPQSIGALEAAVQQIVGVPAADLEALDAERAAGEDIEPALEQLAFSAESFDYLRRIVRLAASGAPLLPSDWTEAYSILVQVRKRRAFARWQAEENAAGLTLGPDHFRLPDWTSRPSHLPRRRSSRRGERRTPNTATGGTFCKRGWTRKRRSSRRCAKRQARPRKRPFHRYATHWSWPVTPPEPRSTRRQWRANREGHHDGKPEKQQGAETVDEKPRRRP